jgi:hypothetical protein
MHIYCMRCVRCVLVFLRLYSFWLEFCDIVFSCVSLILFIIIAFDVIVLGLDDENEMIYD